MSFGLVLSGGGTRGAAHVGVLLALEEHKLLPTSVAGSSAGSIVAGLYSCGYSPKQLKEIVIKLSKQGFLLIDADYIGILKAVYQFFTYNPITFSGLIKGNKLEKYLHSLTSKNIDDVAIKTIIPAVDINSGNTIVYTNDLSYIEPTENVLWKNNILLSSAMRASSAVPTIFQPKIIDNLCLVDGSVTDVLPVNLLLASGENNILAVDLAENYETPKSHNIISVASHSLSIMNTRLRSCTSVGEKLLLKPKLPEHAGLLTFSKMEECMDIGYETTINSMSIIKKLFY